MRWALFRRHTAPLPSDESVHAEAQAHRALRDAKAMTSEAVYLKRRASEVAASSRATRERNHVAEAVMLAIRGV